MPQPPLDVLEMLYHGSQQRALMADQQRQQSAMNLQEQVRPDQGQPPRITPPIADWKAIDHASAAQGLAQRHGQQALDQGDQKLRHDTAMEAFKVKLKQRAGGPKTNYANLYMKMWDDQPDDATQAARRPAQFGALWPKLSKEDQGFFDSAAMRPEHYDGAKGKAEVAAEHDQRGADRAEAAQGRLDDRSAKTQQAISERAAQDRASRERTHAAGDVTKLEGNVAADPAAVAGAKQRLASAGTTQPKTIERDGKVYEIGADGKPKRIK